MKRCIVLAILVALAAFMPARDKKDVDRIAQLEKQIAQLTADQTAIDEGTRQAFIKTAALITDLAAAATDIDRRLYKIERDYHRAE